MRIHRLLLAAFLFLAPSIAAAQIVVPVGGGGSGVPSIAGTTNQINESGSPGATSFPCPQPLSRLERSQFPAAI